MTPTPELERKVLLPRELQRTETWTREELDYLQVVVRKDGRCGSFQTSDGLPCRNHLKVGYTVCRRHGERAPQTINKAERLLAVARMPAIEWILTEMEAANDDTCEACGKSPRSLKERKRLDALAFKLLDRTGFGPGKTINLQTPRNKEIDVLVEQMSEDERLRLISLFNQVRALKEEVRLRLARTVAEDALALPEGRGLSSEVPGELVSQQPD